MAASLLEQIKSLAPPAVVERLSGAVGETPEATDRALTGAAMPAVLGGLIQQFSSGAGPARLMGLVKQQDPNGRMLDNMSAGLGGAAPAQGVGEAERAGQGLIGTLFGDRGGQVADAVAKHGGIKAASATSLLSIAGVMTMGWLGQRVARGGLDAAGLGSMLSNARGELGRVAPPGLAAAIGAPGVAEPAGTFAAAAAGRQTIYREEPVRGEPVERRAASVPSEPAVPAARRWMSWLIPAVLLLGVLLWLLSRLHFGAPQVPRPTIQTPQAPTVPTAPSAPTPQMMAPQAQAPQAQAPQAQAPGAPTATGAQAGAQPPSGAALNLAPNAPAYGLASFLDNPNAPAEPQRFVFRDMSFPTAGSTPSGPSQRVLNNVAAILKAHPNARVQVQGFTDASGADQANLALSQQRADAVRTALIQRGVAPDQVSARGFGGSNPIATNATPAGRAQNRRTDLLVAASR
jgi:OmpA-OmpF porin, OOP family